MEKKLQEINLTYFLIAQDLWQAHYQILSIIDIELNVNMDTMIKM